MDRPPKQPFSSSAYVRRTHDLDIERKIRAQHEYRAAAPVKKAAPSVVRVVAVEPGSLASRIGLQSGDEILEVNGQRVLDVIDLQFKMAEYGEALSLRTRERLFRFVREEWEDLGAEFEPIEPFVCDNDCVFCFVHQNPRQTRRSLHIKDEDYRLSFLFGNYLTLTNLSEFELQRIVDQRLSPLYVSVHATEPELRARMLGNETYDDLDAKLDRLTGAGIQLHCQIVLCPGWNDGPHLEQTVTDLARRYPGVGSAAIVPVGLTRHRDNLPHIDPVTPEYAERTIRQVAAWQARFESQWETPFAFLGDEFYILARQPIPPRRHYQGFPQIENGVGMVRTFLDDFETALKDVDTQLKSRRKGLHGVIATGGLFAPYLDACLRRLDLDLQTVAVESAFWGPGINVAGLLTGSDFVTGLKGVPVQDFVVLPSESMIGEAGVFLDDMTLAEVADAVGAPVFRSGYSAFEFLKLLLTEIPRR